MVNSYCKKEDYQQIVDKQQNIHIVRFSKEPILTPVLDDEGEPTGEYEDSGLVSFTEELIKGDVTLDKVISIRQQEIDRYDTSDAVNSFIYNGKKMWFDKVTRTCISYSMQVEKESGSTTTTLFDNDDVAYTLPIDLALGLFAQLELYAKACYNVTALHKAAINALTRVEDVLNYNIKTGYPEKLVFDSTEQEIE